MAAWSERFHDVVSGRARGIGPGVARMGLSALALPYGIGARLRNRAYDRGWRTVRRAGAPVVSVGNLTVGGTGKTPCVEYLARQFREWNVRVAILSRGYGAEHGPNDEALVLEENLPDVPHLQGRDRVALAAAAVEELESEVLILDDGFQHRRLARDLELVLVDATNPWGFGRLLPRGLLREPVSSLRRAHAVLITRCDQAPGKEVAAIMNRIRRELPKAPVLETCHRAVAWQRHGCPDAQVDFLRGRPLAAFCGLGNPAAFRQSLASLGCSIADFRSFPDHHAYTRSDVAGLSRWAKRQPEDAVIATTQKDMVKLRTASLGERQLWALRIGLHVRPGDEADQLHRMLKSLVTQAAEAAD